MDSDTGAKGKSRFDLSDVMTILDGGEQAKVDEAVEEPQEAAQPEAKAPEVKISIVTLPEAKAPEAKVPAVKAPEAVKAAESQNTRAKAKNAVANNALATKLLADMEQKNAEILKLKSDFMSLQYKINEKDYQLKEKDMNIQGMSSKLSDMQRQLEGQQKQYESLQRQYEDLQKQYDAVKIELDAINEDKARVIARAEAHKLKKSGGSAGEEAPAAPTEDDVASIFKRITQDKPAEPSTETPQQDSVPGMDRPQPPRKLKTAKLYDL